MDIVASKVVNFEHGIMVYHFITHTNIIYYIILYLFCVIYIIYIGDVIVVVKL